eukprot:GHVO01069647.1.p3 GENE.GHVO01069647.1~~GHVO01069647.1.p3  ORF type:complete len:120 (+),score=36.74 GHVO01069647.1:98-457(+)
MRYHTVHVISSPTTRSKRKLPTITSTPPTGDERPTEIPKESEASDDPPPIPRLYTPPQGLKRKRHSSRAPDPPPTHEPEAEPSRRSKKATDPPSVEGGRRSQRLLKDTGAITRAKRKKK